MGAAYPSVLLLGAAPSLVWMAARCLRRAGRAPVILAASGAAPLRWTGDCRRHVRWLGCHGAQPEVAALAQVRQLCASGGIDRVMAADAGAALLLTRALADEGIPCCVMPAPAILRTLDDKWNLTRFLITAGLPTPDGGRADNPAALLSHPLIYPIVTRPLKSHAGAHTQVHRGKAALERAVARDHIKAGYPLLAQSLARGSEVGASFLAQDGALAACAVFRRGPRGEQRFYPSVRVRAYVARFVAACAYSGSGHLALRYNPARDSYVILAWTPGFCSSLLHLERAGVNFPDLLVKMPGAPPARVAYPRSGRVTLPIAERLLSALVGSG